MARLIHRIFLGVNKKPKKNQVGYWLFEDDKKVLFENNDKAILEKV